MFYCRLEADNQRLEADRSHDIYLVQLETLEKTIAVQQKELQQARDESDAIAKLKQNLETKLDKVRQMNGCVFVKKHNSFYSNGTVHVTMVCLE